VALKLSDHAGTALVRLKARVTTALAAAVPSKVGWAKLVSWSLAVPVWPLPVSELALSWPVGVGCSLVLTFTVKLPAAGLLFPAASVKRAAAMATTASSVVAVLGLSTAV
jgi:hypothetical protein